MDYRRLIQIGRLIVCYFFEKYYKCISGVRSRSKRISSLLASKLRITRKQRLDWSDEENKLSFLVLLWCNLEFRIQPFFYASFPYVGNSLEYRRSTS